MIRLTQYILPYTGMATDRADKSRKRKRKPGPSIGTYVLRPLLEDVPLQVDDEVSTAAHITCVEYWGM